MTVYFARTIDIDDFGAETLTASKKACALVGRSVSADDDFELEASK